MKIIICNSSAELKTVTIVKIEKKVNQIWHIGTFSLNLPHA